MCRDGARGGLDCEASCLTISLPCCPGVMSPSDVRSTRQNQLFTEQLWAQQRQELARHKTPPGSHTGPLGDAALGRVWHPRAGESISRDTGSPFGPTLQGPGRQPWEDVGCDVCGQKASASSPFSPAAVCTCFPATNRPNRQLRTRPAKLDFSKLVPPSSPVPIIQGGPPTPGPLCNLGQPL